MSDYFPNHSSEHSKKLAYGFCYGLLYAISIGLATYDPSEETPDYERTTLGGLIREYEQSNAFPEIDTVYGGNYASLEVGSSIDNALTTINVFCDKYDLITYTTSYQNTRAVSIGDIACVDLEVTIEDDLEDRNELPLIVPAG